MQSNSDNSVTVIEANARGKADSNRRPNRPRRRRRRTKSKKLQHDVPRFQKNLKLNVKSHRHHQRCKISSRGITNWLMLPKILPLVKEKEIESKRILQNFSLPCPKNYKIPSSRKSSSHSGSERTVNLDSYNENDICRSSPIERDLDANEDDDDLDCLMGDCSDDEREPRMELKLSGSSSRSSDDQDILTLCVDEDTSWLTGPIPAFYKKRKSR